MLHLIYAEVNFFCPSPLPFCGSTLLSLTRGPAGNRTTTGSLSAHKSAAIPTAPRGRLIYAEVKHKSRPRGAVGIAALLCR